MHVQQDDQRACAGVKGETEELMLLNKVQCGNDLKDEGGFILLQW